MYGDIAAVSSSPPSAPLDRCHGSTDTDSRFEGLGVCIMVGFDGALDMLVWYHEEKPRPIGRRQNQ